MRLRASSTLSPQLGTFWFVLVLLRAEFVLACKYVYPVEPPSTPLPTNRATPSRCLRLCSSTFHPHGKANSLRVTEPGRLTPSFGFSTRGVSTSSPEVG